jgi:NADPH2:quinone reductase
VAVPGRVIATGSADAKLAVASEHGVEHVINYTTTDVVEEVGRINGGSGVDIAFEHVGGDAFATALASLAMDGRLVTCRWTAANGAAIDLMTCAEGESRSSARSTEPSMICTVASRRSPPVG